MSSTFDAVVRKSGNSLVITIPNNVAKAHQIKNGTVLKVNVQKVEGKEVKPQ